MTYSDEIKSRLTAREVFEFYGFTPNRAGFVCCPLHGEKTPSLRIYDGSRGWHCFSCGEGSDVIDFVQKLFGLPLQAACEKLNDDFRLGLPIGKPLSRQEKIEAQRKADERRKKSEERQRRQKSLLREYDLALTEYVALDAIVRQDAPGTPETPFENAFCYALRNIKDAEYRLTVAEAKLCEFERESA